MQFIDPKTDFAFKKIFGSRESGDILKSFINAILQLPEGEQVTDVEILDPYQLPKIRAQKTTILDVKCIDQKGNRYLVEMQLLDVEAFGNRIAYNVCKAYSSQLPKGVGYLRLQNVIAITILDFVMFDELDHCITRHRWKEDKSNRCYFDQLQLYFVELPKFNKKLSELINLTEKWIYFLQNAANIEVVPGELSDEPIKQAFEIANRVQLNQEELDEYENRIIARQDGAGAITKARKEALKEGIIKGLEKGIKKGEEIGIKKGEEKGKKEGKKEAVINATKLGLSTDMIQQITGLSLEDIRKIQKDISG